MPPLLLHTACTTPRNTHIHNTHMPYTSHISTVFSHSAHDAKRLACCASPHPWRSTLFGLLSYAKRLARCASPHPPGERTPRQPLKCQVPLSLSQDHFLLLSLSSTSPWRGPDLSAAAFPRGCACTHAVLCAHSYDGSPTTHFLPHTMTQQHLKFVWRTAGLCLWRCHDPHATARVRTAAPCGVERAARRSAHAHHAALAARCRPLAAAACLAHARIAHQSPWNVKPGACKQVAMLWLCGAGLHWGA